MEIRQIFVFAERAPLSQDLANPRDPRAEMDALGWETDLDQAVRRIQALQPPAVIVASHGGKTDCGPAVASIQKECPGVQIAEINLETRVLRVYNGEEQIVRELELLISAIEGLDAARRDKMQRTEDAFGG